MAKAYAITDEAGYRRWRGISLNNLRQEEVGKRFNPWTQVKKLERGEEYEVWQFFSENNNGGLAFKNIEDFNLLVSHARAELDLENFEKVVIYRLHFGAKTRLLKARDMLFMMYAGKIYTKSMKKFNQQKELDNE